MKTVVILQRVLKKYRVKFYDLLKKSLLQNDIELKVVHGREHGPEGCKQDAGRLKGAIEIKNICLPFGFIWQPCWKHISKADLVIVEQANKYLINYLLMAKRMFSKQKLAFWGHGLTRQKPLHNMGNIFKKAFIGNVDWWFAYTEGVAGFVVSQGFPGDKVTVFRNAIDTRAIVEAKNRLAQDKLDECRKKMNLGPGPVGIFCASMYSYKRIKFLLDACRKVKEDIPSFEMIFLGGGPDSYMVEKAAAGNKWVHYIGPCFGEDKIPYFMLADILLMPGLVGLTVLDSFILKTPIITTKYPYHSPEFEYIQDGINGIITEDNLDSYVGEVKEVLLNQGEINRLKQGCGVSAEKYNIEKMVDRVREGIIKCLS